MNSRTQDKASAGSGERPLVSIVTPAFNAAPYLRRLVESVHCQTYPNIEHIIIDDGSTDSGATVAILKDYPHIRWWSRENKGQYQTLNEGFASAKGTIVTTISADDYYLDTGAIEDVVRAFVSRPGVDIVFGTTVHVDQDGRHFPIQPYQGYPLWFLPYNLFVSHCSLFVRTARLHEHSLFFDSSYRYIGDADWIVRLFRARLPHVRLTRPIAAYRHHPVQTSQQAKASTAASHRDASERLRFKSAYATHRTLQRLVDADVSFHNRWNKARYALRSGGISRLVRDVRVWLAGEPVT